MCCCLFATLLLSSISACNEEEGPPIADLGLPTIPDRVPGWTDDFEEVDCWPDVPDRANQQCGYLTVPEDHRNPEGPTIRLAVTRYFSTRAEVQADPIVYLEGGPGGSGVTTMSMLYPGLGGWIGARDLIALDQRGTGHSIPDLSCTDGSLYADTDAIEDELDFLTQCRAGLEGQGVDLPAYNSARNAADVDALRRALGYAQWNLWGISYGTRLALTVMRDFPAGVRAVILDSTVPLEVNLYERMPANAQGAFERLFATCVADAACAAAYPDLMDVLLAALDDLDASPFQGTLTGGVSVDIDGSAVLDLLFSLMYDYTSLPYLPGLIYMVSDRDMSVILEVLESLTAIESGISVGMFLSVNCAEELAWVDPATFEEATQGLMPRFISHFGYDSEQEFCEVWGVPAASDLETRPVESDIPTVVMAGYFDPITPPEYGQMVRENLSSAFYLEFSNGSHGVSVSDCGAELALAFLDQPNAQPISACLDNLTFGPFFASGGSGVGRIDFAMPGDDIHFDPEALRNALRNRRNRLPHF